MFFLINLNMTQSAVVVWQKLTGFEDIELQVFVFAQLNHQIMIILLESPQHEEKLFPTASILPVSTGTTVAC